MRIRNFPRKVKIVFNIFFLCLSVCVCCVSCVMKLCWCIYLFRSIKERGNEQQAERERVKGLVEGAAGC
jgi:hypothetical protein